MTRTSTGTAVQRWSAVVVIAGFVGVTYGFGIYVFSQLMPDMTRDLGFSYATAGRITGVGQFAFVVFAFAATWLCRRFTGAAVMLGSALLCTLCLVGIGLTRSVVVLTLCLAVAAGTSASVYVPIVDIVPRLVGDDRRGAALGMISSGTTYGVFVSASIIPSVTRIFGWRMVWFAVAGVALVLLVAAVLLFARLGLFRDTTRDTGRAGPAPGRSLAAAAAFVSAWMVGIWIIKFMNGFSFMSFQNFLSPLLRGDGRSIGYASAVWTTIAVVGAAAGFLMGWLGDSIGLRRALTLCYGLFLGSCVLLASTQSGWVPFLAAALFGLSFYPIYGLVPAYVSSVATGAQATLIFGLANVFQGVGGVAGNVVGGSVAGTSSSFAHYYLFLGAGALVLGAATTLLPSDRPRDGRRSLATAIGVRARG